MDKWTASSLRNGFDHRGHQCNACGMHHCHTQVLSSGHTKAKSSMSPSTRAGQEQAGPLAARIRSTSPGSTPRSTGPA